LVPKNSFGQINIIGYHLKLVVFDQKIQLVLNKILKMVKFLSLLPRFCYSLLSGLREAKRFYNRLKQYYASNPVENYGEATKLEEMTLDDAYDEFEDDEDDDETDDESVDMNSDESIINDQEKTSTINGRSKLIDRSANKNGPMPVYRHIKVIKKTTLLSFF
jgi:hypothetical protein